MTTEQAIKYLNFYIKINDKRAIPLTKEELKFKLEEDFTQKVSEAINLLLEDNVRLDKENQKLFEENLFKDQIIDEMCNYLKAPYKINIFKGRKTTHTAIKDYFYKKVEEQE